MMADTNPVTGLDENWCSINEAARRLGVTATAIRNRIKRGTLKVRPNGNFGRLVQVPRPVPVTVTPTPSEPMTVTVPEPVTLTVPDTVGVLVAELRDRIAELQARLVAADAERLTYLEELDKLRVQVAAHEAVKAQVATLNALLEETRQDRDRWHVQADHLVAAQAEHVAELAKLHERMARAEYDRDRATAELAVRLALPWWRRLFA